MSIYDDIKAEMGPAPKYPTKSDFTKFYGYAGGTVIGTFDTEGEAKKAGAKSTEKVVDDAGYEAARKAYGDYNAALSSAWYEAVRAKYPEINDEVFGKVHSMAYDRGHSAGYGEVELYIDDYVDFALDVIKAAKA